MNVNVCQPYYLFKHSVAPEQGTKVGVGLVQLAHCGCTLSWEEWMKHCFQAVNAECAPSFTPLHLKWWQLVDWACSAGAVTPLRIFQSNAGVRSFRANLQKCLQYPVSLFVLAWRSGRDDAPFESKYASYVCGNHRMLFVPRVSCWVHC